MITLDGHSTAVVKLQLESVISYNMGLIKDVGKFVCSAPGSGTFTPDADYSLPASGENLVVRANQNINSETDIGITITGTGSDNAALVGNAVIKAQVAEGQSYQVVPNRDGIKFKTISSVVISNGILGDGFDICVLPDSANDEVIAFDQGLTINPGKEIKPIYDKYNLDHNKRIRGDRTMSLSGFYTNNYTGLARINNREVTLRQDFKDDGGNSITEVVYVDKVRLGVTREAPSADDGECTVKGEGSYGRLFIFS